MINKLSIIVASDLVQKTTVSIECYLAACTFMRSGEVAAGCYVFLVPNTVTTTRNERQQQVEEYKFVEYKHTALVCRSVRAIIVGRAVVFLN